MRAAAGLRMESLRESVAEPKGQPRIWSSLFGWYQIAESQNKPDGLRQSPSRPMVCPWASQPGTSDIKTHEFAIDYIRPDRPPCRSTGPHVCRPDTATGSSVYPG